MVTVKISADSRSFKPIAITITVVLSIFAGIVFLLDLASVITIVSVYDGMGEHAKDYYFINVVEFIFHAFWLVCAIFSIVCLIMFALVATKAIRSGARTTLATFVMINMFLVGVNLGGLLFFLNRNEYILRHNSYSCNDNCETLKACYHVLIATNATMLGITGASSIFGVFMFWS